MKDNKQIDRISTKVFTVNAIAWAGVMLAISFTLQEFTITTASIITTGFLLEMTVLTRVFKELRTQTNTNK